MQHLQIAYDLGVIMVGFVTLAIIGIGFRIVAGCYFAIFTFAIVLESV